MQKPPAHYPISGVCIVADPQKCPAGYELLLKSYDRRDDCDLWGESLMRRATRFLCITRETTAIGRNNVLTGLQICGEKDMPAPGYTILERTYDSSEKALKKKQIGIKMYPRDTITEAICDIVILSKSKRAPEGFTIAGEINGFSLCFKIGNIPIETQAFSHAASTHAAPNRPAPLPPISSSVNQGIGSSATSTKAAVGVSRAPVPAPRPVQRVDSKLANPLADVAFQLNIKHCDLSSLKNKRTPEILFRSIVDIENEFNYSFILEKSAAGRQ